MSKSDATVWGEVEIGELVWFEELHVYCLVPLPEGAQVFPSRWIYSIKRTGLYKCCFV